MAKRRRDYAAEYQARKARFAAARTTLYKQRNAEARRRGYDSLADQRARRKAGDLTHVDHAASAKREGGRYVSNIGNGRWTWTMPHREEGLSREDKARLSQTMDRAWRADVNLTATATWRDESTGRTGTAQAGAGYGVRVRRIHNLGDDGETSIENELRNVSGKSALPPGAHLTSVSLFLFPVERSQAA